MRKHLRLCVFCVLVAPVTSASAQGGGPGDPAGAAADEGPASVPARSGADGADLRLAGPQGSARTLSPRRGEVATGRLPRAVRFTPRWLATISAGVPLRLTRDRALGQERLAPFYLDMLVRYLFADLGPVQHGPALGMSLGLSEDGGFYEPVDALSQVLLVPGYAAARDLGPDALAFGHVAVPFSLAGTSTAGAEVSAGAAYRLRAGLGAFMEAGGAVFFGVEGSAHPMLTIEVGLFVDYEVLP